MTNSEMGVNTFLICFQIHFFNKIYYDHYFKLKIEYFRQFSSVQTAQLDVDLLPSNWSLISFPQSQGNVVQKCKNYIISKVLINIINYMISV